MAKLIRTHQRSRAILILSWAVFAYSNTVSAAATVHGIVRAAGHAASGAQVSLHHRDSGIAVSVFAQRDGRYTIISPFIGEYEVRASWTTFAAQPQKVVITNTTAHALDIPLIPDPAFIERVTSAQWLSLLPEGAMKREFILNCASCHEIESSRILVDGKPRTTEQWIAAFAMMRAIDQYKLLPDDFDDATYAAWLAQHLHQKAITSLSPAPPQNIDTLANVRITEYPLPVSSELPHDLVVGPAGRIWITGFFTDVIWAMDPATGAMETYAIRPDGATGAGNTRALAFAPDGTLWIVLGGTHELVALDPATRKFSTYNIGMYAHSLVLDDLGRVWFNDYFAETARIGVFDPATAALRHIDLPPAPMAKAQGLPLPYGLQIDKVGRLYSTQMAANTVVMYNTKTAAAELMHMPVANAAPRRPAVGDDDTLWIPEWNTGHLSGYDPSSRAFKRYRLGQSTLGAYDAEFDRRSGRVWVTAALDSSMILFDPADGAVLEIPLPTHPAYTRHLAIDPNTGDLWSAYSSLPAAAPKIVRIQLSHDAIAERPDDMAIGMHLCHGDFQPGCTAGAAAFATNAILSGVAK